MKSILLHVHDDDGLESRFQVALDVVRATDGHLSCIQVLPVQDYLVGEPIGGFFPSGQVVDEIQHIAAKLRERIEGRLQDENVRWDWVESMSEVPVALDAASALSDLLIVSQYPGPKELRVRPLPIVTDMAQRTSCAMLVVPSGTMTIPFDTPMVIGWNGSVEAAHALRQALPLIAMASRVEIVAVGKDDGEFSQEAANLYLSRHNINSALHQIPVENGSIAGTLERFALEQGASALMIGAYGHSRLREALMGGVTRDLLTSCKVPLLIGH